MFFTLLAQTTTVGPGWSQAIQKALQSILSPSNLAGWVDKALVCFQFIGTVIVVFALTRKFQKQSKDPEQMGQVVVAMIVTLAMMGMPRLVFGAINKVTQGVTPTEWRVNWKPDHTFEQPKIMSDMTAKVNAAINPKGYNAGGSSGGDTKHSAWVGWIPGLTKVLDGVDSLDPKYWIGFALSAVVQFFADTALFVLGILYMVMALVQEVNLLVFPLVIACYHTELYGNVSREIIKHSLAVFLWPLGWGVGILSAQGVMSGITNFSPTIAGLIGFTLSLFLVCFWLCFASVAGPALFHKLATSGGSIGQSLMAGGLGAGGAMAMGAAGTAAGAALSIPSSLLGKAISSAGGNLARLIRGNGSGSNSRGGGRGEEGGGSAGASEQGGGGESGESSLGRTLANDPMLREMQGGLAGNGKAADASGGSGGTNRSANVGSTRSQGGTTSGGESAGGGEDESGGGAQSAGSAGTSSGGTPSMASRVRGWAATGIEKASGGLAAQAASIPQRIKGAAARGAVKLDRVGDAYAEVGGSPVSMFKSNNRALTRRAENSESGGRNRNPGGDDDDGQGDEGDGDEGGGSKRPRWRSGGGRVEKRPAKREKR